LLGPGAALFIDGGLLQSVRLPQRKLCRVWWRR
jgi:hypothetical protein